MYFVLQFHLAAELGKEYETKTTKVNISAHNSNLNLPWRGVTEESVAGESAAAGQQSSSSEPQQNLSSISLGEIPYNIP